ncbi:DinB family protein [Rhodocytophaga aerolata]|uniref:DinB family protein n=1 Tax=Rhodocytophaga aerolata TaxID=455078 RepID=A0ABT8R4A0_9BACT|nr:DinB family protein [Rhodocytophaga aerolata]MDO1446053.1 DinB family protein [Rhodocytophaga aerolata]
MIDQIISKIETDLIETFAAIDRWFDVPDTLGNFTPSNSGWTIHQILEHVSLTNHFLLILIEKGKRKALQMVDEAKLQEALATYAFESDQLTQIGMHQSFIWIRPEHMEPRGEKPMEEIRQLLKEQLAQCLAVLEALPNGEGVLYKTTMSVNNLGKIDVYQYIYFLARHARRHLEQMQKVATEYTQVTNKQ